MPREKKADFIREFEIKKVFVGKDIKKKETQMGPNRGAISLGSHYGDKKLRAKKKADFIQEFEIKKVALGKI